MSRRSIRWALTALVVWNLVACSWLASSQLTSKRYWDERFSVGNVKNVLVEGTLRPETGWYGRLSYLPQTAILAGLQSLYRLTGLERLEVFRSDGRFSASAYLVSRWVTVLYGTGSLILTFLIGRRVFSSGVALLGTTLLATSPWVLRHFVTFKPDALVLLLVLATSYWALDALERPSRVSFLIAGLGVGLAVSTKYTGALASIPVVAAALAAWDGWRRALERLTIAGAAATAVFLLLHPDLGFYLHFLRMQDRFYSAEGGHSFGSMLVSEVSNLLHWSFHGPWLGVVALVGVGALGLQLIRVSQADSSNLRLPQLALFLSFPLGFSVIYALATSWPKGNNYLVIVPFTSLAAAWLLHEVWRWLAERIPASARRPTLWVALAGLLLLEVWPANAYIYSETVGTTTFDQAVETVRRLSPSLSRRTAVYETGEGTLDLRSKRPGHKEILVAQEVTALTEVTEERLDLVDFEIFAEDRLQGPRADFYRRRMQRLDAKAIVIHRPEWFKAIGPSRVLLLHPWYWLSPPEPIVWQKERPKKGGYVGRLPRGLRAGQPISLEARIPRNTRALTSVNVGDMELAFLGTGWDQDGERFSTRRFALPAPNLKVRLEWAETPPPEDSPRVALVRWTTKRPRRIASSPGARSW
ncbi:MAG: glycosyltransferase family 39 protein [bacterium]|nr:glycosyltransferase family 39 protein [bacterium]